MSWFAAYMAFFNTASAIVSMPLYAYFGFHAMWKLFKYKRRTV